MNIHPWNLEAYLARKIAYKKYRAKVDRLTEKVAHMIPGIEKRKFREWDLDHIIPVKYGFKNKIPPEKIAALPNLRIIPHKENFRKGSKLTHPVTILDAC